MHILKWYPKKVLVTLLLFAILLIFFLIITHTSPRHNEVKSNPYYLQKSISLKLISQKQSNRNCEVVHLAIVCAGFQARHQVVTLIKSLLFYRKNPLHVHFLVNENTKLVLSHLLQTWDLPDFTVSFYVVEKELYKISWIPNKHYSGVYGLLKIIILEILPKHVEKVIALDTDLVFTESVAKLWDLFQSFEHEEAIGLVENQSDWYLGTLWLNYTPWPALGRGFNTGVMLLHCRKLRAWKWDDKWPLVARKVIKRLGSSALADQDVINAVLRENPSVVHVLPCKWNMQLSDNVKVELCYSNYSNDIGILHWNNQNKQAIRRISLKSMQNIYQTFADMNGDLIKKPLFHCRETSDLFLEDTEIEEFNDPCHELRESTSILHRTHLYYLPFEYNEDGRSDVSIVVQLSFDRLPMLEKVCAYWKGPVSAAIFLSDYETLQLIHYTSMSDVFRKRKNIAFHIVFRDSNEKIYPINFLRNVALQNVKTEYVFLYDVDFSPMPHLYEYITSAVLSEKISNLTAFIIPAFESLWYKFEMPQSKSQLLEMMDEGSITTFRSYIWPQGHAATNFTKWKTAKKTYNVSWEPDFEPYVVLKKHNCPLYHKGFSGYGWNKVSHIMELDAAGFVFVVLPFGFITHLPHAPSLDLIKYRSQAAYRECLNQAQIKFTDYLFIKYGKSYE